MTDPALITAAAGIIGTILAIGIGLAALIVTTTGRLSARLTAVEKEQARTSGLLVWNETVPRPSTALAGRRPRQRSPLEGLGFIGRAGASPSGAGS